MRDSTKDVRLPAAAKDMHGLWVDSDRWRRRAQLLIALLLGVRWVYAACVPLELVADEAYYWDWSRRLDWGYYSKPPMVAWLIRAATELGGSTAWVIRTPAVLLGTLSLWWIYLLAARLFDPRVGFWSVVLCAATPGNTALGLLMTIDAPFLFCWGMAMYGLWRMLERGPGRGGWVLATGVSAGLGLLSKESMLAFLMAAWLFVLLSREDRGELQRPGWWLMSLIAAACLVPVILWNSRHGWITVLHSSSHFEMQSTVLATRLLRSGEFLASQLGVVSPVTVVVFGAVGALALRRWRRLTRPVLFLVCFSVVPLSCVIVLSLTRRVMPNWPAPFYAGGLVLTAAWLADRVDVGELPRSLHWLFPSRSRLLRRSVWCGVACVAIAGLSPWAVHWLGLAGSKLDPTVRLRGWSNVAAQIARSRAAAPRPETTFVFVATGRQEASQLAFHLPGQPDVSLWNPTDKVFSQYDLWPGPVDKVGCDAVIVTHPQAQIDPRIAQQFRGITQCSSAVDAALGRGRNRHYSVWIGHDYQPLSTESTEATSDVVASNPGASSAR